MNGLFGTSTPKSSGGLTKAPSTASSPAPMRDPYRDEDDHRTLMRAAEVAGDPSRLAGARRHQRKVQKGLASVGKLLGKRGR